MNTSKIIRGVVSSGRYTVTAPIIKEDYGLYLQIEGVELPSTYQVDFSNDEHHGTSVTMIGNSDGVLIPSQFISSGKDVFAFLYHVGADFGRTVYKFRIPNKVRPDRTNEQPTPEEQSVIDQAISALNGAVAQTAQDVIDADASAQSASQSAENAHDSAVDAQNYAESAQTSANNASASASLASASATASAQSASQSAQIKTDVEDLADDAQGYAQTSAQSASASAQSARASAISASQAHGFADDASASASSAQGYANTASAKAQDASGYAHTASQKASEASQSAENALTYKTDAESAKTASQTAQGLAESARDSAISAKTDAESARDEAQNLVDGISGKVEQIDANTERIESLEDDRYKPYVIDSASGAVASFTDGADNIPLKSLAVDINPIQDLSHGDPSPTNICPISGWTRMQLAQTGKNLFPYKDVESQTKNGVTFTVEKSNGVITNIHMQGTATAQFSFPFYVNGVDEQWVLPKGDFNFYIGGDKPTQSRTFDINVRKAGTTSDITAGSNVRTITLSEQTTFGSAYIWIYSGAVLNHNIIPVIVQSGVDTSVKYPIIQRHSVTVQLGQTVYGGKLDVLTGILTVYPYYDSYNGETLTGEWISDRDKYVAGTAPTIGAQVVNIGAEGTEYQLTPHEVKSLLGANNIFADTGDTAVEYRADTKLYIEKLTQPEEDDMVADSAITSGQFFMVGNTLYRALSNIASGATITVGTNAQRVSLSDALNLVNA